MCVYVRVCVCVCRCVCVWGSVLMSRVLVKHGAKGGPMKKGVKHIEEHFSVEWKKEGVPGTARGEKETESR